MGKFMLRFDQEEPPLIRTSAEEQSLRFVVKEEEHEGNLFQKALCYTSYYMMTFTAFCVFTPHKVAYAAEVIRHSIPS